MGRQLSPVAEIFDGNCMVVKTHCDFQNEPKVGWGSLLFVKRPETPSKGVAVMVSL